MGAIGRAGLCRRRCKFFGGNLRRDDDDYLAVFAATSHLAMELVRVEPRHMVDALRRGQATAGAGRG